ncbi:MAG: tail fiber protein [Myxococcales bacterium]|nr:tail fiber protein [Myxococcales bacterium]
MTMPILGEIKLFAGAFVPTGWAACDGRMMPIQHFAALFSLLGTTYGGDGRTTFALPDLRGRVPIHGPPGTQGGDAALPSTTVAAGTGATAAAAGASNMQPYLALTYIIAIDGVFPSRG